MQGWYAYEAEKGKMENPLEMFSVQDTMIRMFGKRAGYLMSEKSFKNFQLTVEFKWNMDTSFARKSDKKNSGVMYLVPRSTKDTLWPQGIQFQIKDGATGDFVLLQNLTLLIKGQKTEPGKSMVVKRMTDASKPDNEWNTLIVTVRKGSVKQELNGQLVNEGTAPSVSSGRILLQYEGFPIDFRKVEIKKL